MHWLNLFSGLFLETQENHHTSHIYTHIRHHHAEHKHFACSGLSITQPSFSCCCKEADIQAFYYWLPVSKWLTHPVLVNLWACSGTLIICCSEWRRAFWALEKQWRGISVWKRRQRFWHFFWDNFRSYEFRLSPKDLTTNSTHFCKCSFFCFDMTDMIFKTMISYLIIFSCIWLAADFNHVVLFLFWGVGVFSIWLSFMNILSSIYWNYL